MDALSLESKPHPLVHSNLLTVEKGQFQQTGDLTHDDSASSSRKEQSCAVQLNRSKTTTPQPKKTDTSKQNSIAYELLMRDHSELILSTTPRIEAGQPQYLKYEDIHKYKIFQDHTCIINTSYWRFNSCKEQIMSNNYGLNKDKQSNEVRTYCHLNRG